MDTLANSEDPDEMQHNAAFHQVLHCLLTKSTFREINAVFSLDCVIWHVMVNKL